MYDRSYAPGDPTISLADFERGYLIKGGEFWKRDNYADRMPGEAFEYSNVGAALAALGLEVVAGQSYAEVVQDRILDPLGMDSSGFYLSDLSQDPATLYGTFLGGGWKPYEQYGFPTYPDGLMRSSANDLARYLAAILSDEPGILSAERVAEMLTVDESAGTDEDGQAIAWSRRELGGRALYGHNGFDYGALTEVWIDVEEGTGIAIVINADYINSAPWEDLFALEDALLDLVESE
ncbi:MAG: CubicO group peptidase (beta-lactamase class C family) [Cognaticolwellia sp.]